MKTEFALEPELRIDPRAVCGRMAYRTPGERRVLWWLHALAAEPGAVERVCAEVVKANPERLETDTMAKIGTPPGGVFSETDARRIRRELEDNAHPDAQTARDREIDEALAEALSGHPRPMIAPKERSLAYFRGACQANAGSLPALVMQRLRQGLVADPAWFQDLPGALAEYASREGTAAGDSFYQTNVGKVVWGTLEWCLVERRPVYLCGREGRGKSEAARAFVRAHRGEARIFTVPGNGTKPEIFREMAGALGLPHRSANGAGMLPAQIADVLRRSGLALVIDEAHFLLMRRGQGGRPEMLDWIDSALVDHGVPVALVSTPQFHRDLGSLEKTTGYNAGQFLRRFAGRWKPLPETTERADLLAIAARELPRAGAGLREKAVDYAIQTGRDVSGLGDVIKEARSLARRAGRAEVLPEDLKAAVGERAHNDMALSRTLNEMAGMKRSRRFVPVAVPAPMPPPMPAPAEPAPDFEAVNRRLTAPVLDRRPAAASLIHGVESPVLA
jgi:hypothetical protein